MKKLLFVLTTAVLLFLTACGDGSFVDPGMMDSIGGGGIGGGGSSGSGGSSGGGLGTEKNPIKLTENKWTNGEITSKTPDGEIWYSFNVTKETTYYIWWNDSRDGDGTKTLDITVEAAYKNGSNIWYVKDNSWTTPNSFKASSNDTVLLIVDSWLSSSHTGTFAIAYTTTNTRPN